MDPRRLAVLSAAALALLLLSCGGPADSAGPPAESVPSGTEQGCSSLLRVSVPAADAPAGFRVLGSASGVCVAECVDALGAARSAGESYRREDEVWYVTCDGETVAVTCALP